MANRKTGHDVSCNNCSALLYLPRYRINRRHSTYFCSAKCRDSYWAPIRSAKLRKHTYPMVLGICLHCKGNIVAKNSGFVKKRRVYCTMLCRRSYEASTRLRKNGGLEKLPRWRSDKPGRRWSNMRRLAWAKQLSGEHSRFWRGGLTDSNRNARNSTRYAIWRAKVFKRDNYMCVMCGARSGNGTAVYLNADHIKPWSQYVKLRFDVKNGRTLCVECHRNTDTFGHKTRLSMRTMAA